jgi:hypothetical protein
VSTPGEGRRPTRDVIDDHTIRGGLTGIALVALATLGLTVVAAVVVALALLIAG